MRHPSTSAAYRTANNLPPSSPPPATASGGAPAEAQPGAASPGSERAPAGSSAQPTPEGEDVPRPDSPSKTQVGLSCLHYLAGEVEHTIRLSAGGQPLALTLAYKYVSSSVIYDVASSCQPARHVDRMQQLPPGPALDHHSYHVVVMTSTCLLVSYLLLKISMAAAAAAPNLHGGQKLTLGCMHAAGRGSPTHHHQHGGKATQRRHPRQSTGVFCPSRLLLRSSPGPAAAPGGGFPATLRRLGGSTARAAGAVPAEAPPGGCEPPTGAGVQPSGGACPGAAAAPPAVPAGQLCRHHDWHCTPVSSWGFAPFLLCSDLHAVVSTEQCKRSGKAGSIDADFKAAGPTLHRHMLQQQASCESRAGVLAVSLLSIAMSRSSYTCLSIRQGSAHWLHERC